MPKGEIPQCKHGVLYDSICLDCTGPGEPTWWDYNRLDIIITACIIAGIVGFFAGAIICRIIEMGGVP